MGGSSSTFTGGGTSATTSVLTMIFVKGAASASGICSTAISFSASAGGHRRMWTCGWKNSAMETTYDNIGAVFKMEIDGVTLKMSYFPRIKALQNLQCHRK